MLSIRGAAARALHGAVMRVHIEGNHGLRVGTALCVHLSENMAISSRPIASWLAVADGGVS